MRCLKSSYIWLFWLNMAKIGTIYNQGNVNEEHNIFLESLDYVQNIQFARYNNTIPVTWQYIWVVVGSRNKGKQIGSNLPSETELYTMFSYIYFGIQISQRY